MLSCYMEQKAEVHCAVKLHGVESKGALCCHITWSRKQRCTVLSSYIKQKAEVHCAVKLHKVESRGALCCQVT